MMMLLNNTIRIVMTLKLAGQRFLVAKYMSYFMKELMKKIIRKNVVNHIILLNSVYVCGYI